MARRFNLARAAAALAALFACDPAPSGQEAPAPPGSADPLSDEGVASRRCRSDDECALIDTYCGHRLAVHVEERARARARWEERAASIRCGADDPALRFSAVCREGRCRTVSLRRPRSEEVGSPGAGGEAPAGEPTGGGEAPPGAPPDEG